MQRHDQATALSGPCPWAAGSAQHLSARLGVAAPSCGSSDRSVACSLCGQLSQHAQITDHQAHLPTHALRPRVITAPLDREEEFAPRPLHISCSPHYADPHKTMRALRYGKHRDRDLRGEPYGNRANVPFGHGSAVVRSIRYDPRVRLQDPLGLGGETDVSPSTLWEVRQRRHGTNGCLLRCAHTRPRGGG